MKIIKPNDLWYTVGLIVTDGNLSKDGRHINITSKDLELLEKLKAALYIQNKLVMKSSGSNKEKIYGFLQFGDVVFYKFLMSIGLLPAKSLTLKSVSVPKEYFADFLRGIIDGDGSINTWINNKNGYVQWALRICSASSEFANWLLAEIQTYYKVRGKIHTSSKQLSRNPMYIIKFGKLPAQLILRNIYYTNCLSLARKYKKASECQKAKNGFLNYGNVIQ